MPESRGVLQPNILHLMHKWIKPLFIKSQTAKFIDLTIDPEHFSGLSVYVPLSKWTDNKEYEYYFTMDWSSVY